MRTRAIACIVTAISVIAFGAGGGPLAAGAPATGAPGAAKPVLSWKKCDGGFECATLKVPRDWDRPKGKRLRLALIRLRATKKPIGSLLINYGGPGASGLSSLRQSGKLIRKATRGRMHVVSWDPRGVGQSAPVLCPEGNDAFYNADPTTPEGLTEMAQAVALRAQACAQRFGDYLGDIGTDQVVQDMDAIRKAVGDREVSFLGLSYGTRVGTVYAQRYPKRVRAMVLDVSLPPVSTLTSISEGLAPAFEGALHEWFRRCAAAPPCAFGDDPAAGFDALVAHIRNDRPVVPNTGGRRLTVGLFNQVILAGIINFQGSTRLAAGVIADFRATGDPTKLFQVAEIIAGGRRPDGTYASNGTEIFQCVNCLDWQDRPTVTQVCGPRRRRPGRRTAPRRFRGDLRADEQHGVSRAGKTRSPAYLQ